MSEAHRVPQTGSVLIEAVVAVGMLAVLVAATATTHRAAVETALRSEERISDVRRAEEVLESSYVTEVGSAVLMVGDAPPICAASPMGAAALRRVPISQDGATPDRSIALVGLRNPSGRTVTPSEGPGGALRVHLHDRAWSAPLDVELRSSEGIHPVVRGAGGCFEARALPSGSYEVVVRVGGVPLVDRTHVPLDVRPVVATVRQEDVDVVVDALEPTMLTVVADTTGARPPDEVRPGSLGWLVTDDDAWQVTPLGSSRSVHPGRVRVVVSACGNPDAPASQRTVDVVGAASTVMVPLATARVDGIDGRADAVLELFRAHSCADGSGSRPSLRWIGGLSDGMRIALPAGVWDARLLSSTGTRLTTAAQVSVGRSEAQVSIP